MTKYTTLVMRSESSYNFQSYKMIKISSFVIRVHYSQG